MCKVINTVPALAWLRRAVRRWRSRGAASVRPNKDVLELDAAVPAGHVAVRVEGRRAGEPSSTTRRFVVRLEQLSHPAFRELLRQAEEEYGFPSASGPVVLPCDEDHLRDVLRRVSLSEERPSFRRRRGVVAAPHGDCDSWPLLQGAAVEKLVS